MVLAKKTEVQKSGYTKLEARYPIQAWSSVLYVPHCPELPSRVTCHVRVNTKTSAQKSGHKYWKGEFVGVVVDRNFVLATLKSKLYWFGDEVVCSFDNQSWVYPTSYPN